MRSVYETYMDEKMRKVYRFHVYELVSCPFRELQERTREEKEKMKNGRRIHEIIEKELEKQGYIIEQSISYKICNNDKCIEIIATPDAIHRQKLEVIEIKPSNIIGLYHRQLSAYANILYLKERTYYTPYFMKYRVSNGRILVEKQKLFWWDMRIINELLKVANIIISKGYIPIGNETCKWCKCKFDCIYKYKWVRKYGWKIEEIKAKIS